MKINGTSEPLRIFIPCFSCGTYYWLRVFVTLENRNGQDLKEGVICRESCRAIGNFLGILWPFDLKLDVWMC